MTPILNIYRRGILFRIICMVLMIAAIFYIVLETWFWLVAVWLTIVFIFQIIEFIRYTERYRAELVGFMTAISQGDMNSAYAQSKTSKQYNELTGVLEAIRKSLVKLREEKEENYHYLMALVEHISIPLVCFNKDYQIQLSNRAVKQLFHAPVISSIYSFERINPNLSQQIMDIKPGQKALVKCIHQNELLNLSLLSTEFIMGNAWYKIVTFQDIRYELEVKESDSWQKLTSVISHEISNSVIPIATLSRTLSEMISERSNANAEALLKDIGKGLQSIESRSSGLVNFVQITKKLRQIPEPEYTHLSCSELFNQVQSLISPIMKSKQIRCSFNLQSEEMILLCDKNLIEQTLINLLMNAIEATENQPEPEIIVSGVLSDANRFQISVSDNGTGILPENLEKIFIPHFTTKTHGSGIGLSLARRIMHIHRGIISVKSLPGRGSEFILKF